MERKLLSIREEEKFQEVYDKLVAYEKANDFQILPPGYLFDTIKTGSIIRIYRVAQRDDERGTIAVFTMKLKAVKHLDNERISMEFEGMYTSAKRNLNFPDNTCLITRREEYDGDTDLSDLTVEIPSQNLTIIHGRNIDLGEFSAYFHKPPNETTEDPGYVRAIHDEILRAGEPEKY